MILNQGDKVLITHRRLYEKDDARYFVGDVAAYDNGIMKVVGFSFIKDLISGSVIRKDEPRTKIVSLASYAFIVYELPRDIDILKIRFENKDGQQMLTDDANLKMNLAEYPKRGHM